MSRQQEMACPIDGTQLVMSERQGIEMDYCPACRGVWLDRGELDKIVERSAVQTPAVHEPQHRPASQHHHYGHKKRRKSFLEDLLD